MKYDAFISYRHVPRDIAVAENLHKLLEHYRVPKNVQKMTGKQKIHRVFRDRDELPLADNLSDNLLTALDQSEYLLVICSPESKESIWVQREVEYFIKTHDRNHVLAVLTAGEPEEAFPDLILHEEKKVTLEDGSVTTIIEDVEPLAADVRADSIAQSVKILKKEKLRVLAALLGCEYNDLRQRHKEAKMRRAMALASVVITLLTGFLIYAYIQNGKIQREYTEKQISQARNLASYSQQSLADGDRETAILLALEALPDGSGDKEKPVVSAAVNALTDAVYAYQTPAHDWYLPEQCIRFSGSTNEYGMRACHISPEGTYFSAFDDSEKVQIYKTESGEKIHEITVESLNLKPMEDAFYQEILMYAGFVSEEELVIVTNQHILGLDLDRASVLWQKELPEENPHSSKMLRKGCVEFSRDRSLLAVYYYENYWVFDLKKQEFLRYESIRETISVTESDITFSPDGKKLLLCSYNNYSDGKDAKKADNLRMIDVASGKIEALPVETSSVLRATFETDHSILLLTASELPMVNLTSIMHVNYQVIRYDLISKETEILLSGESGYQDYSKPSLLVAEATLDDGGKEGRIIGCLGNQLFVLKDSGDVVSQVVTEAMITNLELRKDNFFFVGLENGTIGRYNLTWDYTYPIYPIISLDNYVMSGFYYCHDQKKMIQIPKNGNKCVISGLLSDDDYQALPVEGDTKEVGYYTFLDDRNKLFRHVATEDGLYLWNLENKEESQKLFETLKPEHEGELNLRMLFEDEEGHLNICYTEDWTNEENEKMQTMKVYDHDGSAVRWSKEIAGHYPEVYCSDISDFIFWVDGNDFAILDRMTGEVADVNYDNSFCGAEGSIFTQSIDFTSDGRYVIWVAGDTFKDKAVYRYDLQEDVWDVFPGLEAVEKYMDRVAIARKSNLLAYCKDGTSIDIYDIGTMELLYQIPVEGKTTVSYFFLNNEKYLIYQSDDQVFRSIDLENNKIVMEDTDTYTAVHFYSSDNDRFLRLSAHQNTDQGINYWTQYSQYIFWVEDNGTFALYTQIPSGIASIAAREVMVEKPDKDTAVGVYPFYDLDQLIEKAREIIGDKELTETEKVKYFIENN